MLISILFFWQAERLFYLFLKTTITTNDRKYKTNVQ